MWPRALALCSMGSLLLFGLALGCSRAPTSSEPDADPITDRQYLTADVWNDGQAEVVFYRVERTRDQYGRAKEQAFIMGTYLAARPT